uniref:centromere protein N isoform X3 n=1 Tax=Myxine glutinosa TaxID=7769 RepID=UPI00358F728C
MEVMQPTAWMILRQLIIRCKIGQSMKLLESWGYFSHNELQRLKQCRSKMALVSAVRPIAEENDIALQQVMELELLYVQLFSKQKNWRAFKLTDPENLRAEPIDQERLRADLQIKLSLFFKSISIQEWSRKAKLQRCTVQAVFYPLSAHIFLTFAKPSIQDHLLQVLHLALKYRRIEVVSLSGHCLESLSDIVSNKANMYGLQNPILAITSKHNTEAERDPWIIDENKKDKERAMALTCQSFGTQPQPVLEELAFTMATRFRGLITVPEMKESTDIFAMKVLFQNKNVLEAINRLAPLGLGHPPLPYILRSVPHNGRNHFHVSDRKRKLPGKDSSEEASVPNSTQVP